MEKVFEEIDSRIRKLLESAEKDAMGDEAERRQSVYQRAIEDLELLKSVGTPGQSQPVVAPKSPSQRGGRRPTGRMSAAGAAKHVLESSGPLQFRDLYNKATKFFVSNSKSPDQVFYQALRKARDNGEVNLDEDGFYSIP